MILLKTPCVFSLGASRCESPLVHIWTTDSLGPGSAALPAQSQAAASCGGLSALATSSLPSSHGQMTLLQECTSAVWTLSQNGCGGAGDSLPYITRDSLPYITWKQVPTVSDGRSLAGRPSRKEQVEWNLSVPATV